MRVLPFYLLVGFSLMGCKKKMEEPVPSGATVSEGSTSATESESSEDTSSPWGGDVAVEEATTLAETSTVTDTTPMASGDEGSGGSPTASGSVAESATPASSSSPDTGRAALEEQLIIATGQLTLGTEAGATAALSILEPLSQQHPTIAGISHNMGIAYLQLGEDGNAEAAFQRAATIDSGMAGAWRNWAVLLEQRGSYNSALAKVDMGLLDSPSDLGLQLAKVHLLRKMKRFEDAIAYATEVVKRNGKSFEAYDALGMVFLDQADSEGDSTKAVSARTRASFVYQLVENLDIGAERSASIRTNKGRMELARGEPERAKMTFLSVVYDCLENPLFAQYTEEQRIAYCQTLPPHEQVALDVNALLPRLYLADLDLDQHRFETAKDYLKRASELAPHIPGIWISLGVAYSGLSQDNKDDEVKRNEWADKAIEAYLQALALDPDNIEPKLNIAVVKADRKGLYDEALDIIAKYLDDGGQNQDLAQTWQSSIANAKEVHLQELANQEADRLYQLQMEEEERERQRLLEEGETEQPTEVDGGSSGDMTTEESITPVEDPSSGESTNVETVTPSDDSEGGETVVNPPPPEPTTVDPAPVPEPSSVEAPVPENSEAGAAETPNVDDDPWGGASSSESDASMSANEGAGLSVIGTSCAAVGSCDADGVECASDGVCRESSTSGTFLVGEGCLEDSDCAYGLSCGENMCSELSEDPVSEPESNPWGG